MPGLSAAELEELMTDEDEMDRAQLRRIHRKEEKQREKKQKPRPEDWFNNEN